jgi:hypothetical protein
MTPATRRLVALVCIGAVILTGAMPGAMHAVVGVLAPVDPLFGLVVVARVAPADNRPVGADPVLAVRSPRAPPIA